MPKVVITHAVEDVDRWLQGHAGRAETIAAASVSNLTDYVAADGSNNVAVTADASDPEKLIGLARFSVCSGSLHRLQVVR